jgi:hypothetical protein
MKTDAFIVGIGYALTIAGAWIVIIAALLLPLEELRGMGIEALAARCMFAGTLSIAWGHRDDVRQIFALQDEK